MNSSKVRKDSWQRVDGEIDKEEETGGEENVLHALFIL